MKKRIIALALVLVTALSLVGCGKTEMAEGSLTEGLCYEVTGISPDTVVAVIDGREIPMDLYFYWLNYSAASMADFMNTYMDGFDWDYAVPDGSSVAGLIVEDALSTITRFAVMENLAEENNVILTESQLAELDALREQQESLEREDKFAGKGQKRKDIKPMKKKGLLSGFGKKNKKKDDDEDDFVEELYEDDFDDDLY